MVATISLSFKLLQNLRLTDSVPVVRTVPGGSNLILTRVERIDPMASINAEPRIEADLGSDSTRPDPTILYAMPFGGEQPQQLVATFGSWTHRGENFFSLDFALPGGTPVLAARSGVVAIVQDSLPGGGEEGELIGKANLVVVGHSDGTLASYAYLSTGIAVAVGDSVARGQFLGLSGSGGALGLPHLHFHVGKRLTRAENRTIRVLFESPTGGVHDLSEGSWCLPSRQVERSRGRRSEGE
ncbi:MAG: M23 family metallopeptidase [Longimicrobiales bacterium]|nr:M23 family metallopeptidase [Longimicrobiales bacterium]